MPEFNYDITTDEGRVRLLCTDVGGGDGTQYVFNDAEIAVFLDLGAGNVFSAAAVALRTLAANEALVQKRIEFLELKTDGPATAKSLGELADKLDTKAASSTDFEIAGMAVDQFSYDEMLTDWAIGEIGLL